jgi:choline dehydrogenase-like flavoprotein
MVTAMKTLEADCAIFGSGPGGATVAREVSRRGKKVVICEAGGYHRQFGYTPFLLNMMANFGLTSAKEE